MSALRSTIINRPVCYNKDVFRIVETQEDAATMALMKNIEKQTALESLLDEYKPPYADQQLQYRHYLIASPFRYPPLPWGSRFGQRFEKSYFYASESSATCIAESVYYRFVFFAGKASDFSMPVLTEHCLFSLFVASDACADFTQVTDSNLLSAIVSPDDYSQTHKIGRECRNNNIHIIRYPSARDTVGINLAIDNPEVIKSNEPLQKRKVMMQINQSRDRITVKTDKNFPVIFTQAQFTVDGTFPKIQ